MSGVEDEMEKVKWLEYEIQLCMERIDSIEKLPKSGDVPANKQSIYLKELEEIRKLLNTHQKQLHKLRSRNRWFTVTIIVFLVIVALYMGYILMYPRSLRYSFNYQSVPSET